VRRRYVTVAVVVGVVTGAAIAAALRTVHFSYAAEATIDARVAAGSAAGGAQAVRTMVAAAGTDAVLDPARTTSGIASIAGQVRLLPDPGAGILVVRATANTGSTAIVEANAYADALVQFLRAERLREGGAVVIGDFESDLDGWELAPPLFPIVAPRLSRSTSVSFVGNASLLVDCRGVGCGTWVRIYYPFREGVRYTAVGHVKLASGTNAVALTVGGPTDHVRSRPLVPTRRWSRVGADWVPSRTEPYAEVALTTMRPAPVAFYVDGVTLDDSSAVGSSRPVGERAAKPLVFWAGAARFGRGKSTAAAAGIGAAVGLLVIAGGLLAGHFALRAAERRRQPDQQPHQ
jgi:hypothetical protein